eukprot:TRINITY_DN18577_c0_g1_i2.p1 TRINITY_DN18577_c0_g1~~TRINITY_DN18577_c0_g1_i2.p1  ORF type:complete len:395 (-),score=70.01 TRINITY_DN18577_c0_g1_i2:282-1418(-)
MASPGQATVDVEDRLRFDETSLQRFLVAQGLPGMEGGPLRVKKFGYGQSNPTYFLETVAGHKYVLRKQPPGKLIKGAHAVDREFRVLKAVGEAGYSVPTAHVLCQDGNIIGTSFYVMSFMKGQIPDNGLQNLPNEHKRPVMKAIVQSLAKLHSYDPEKLGLLGGEKPFGRIGGFYDRQIQTLSRTSEAQVAGSEGKVPAMVRMPELLRLFQANMPEDRSCIIHGDWKPDNVVLTDGNDGSPRVVAVLDWELSTIGHPMSDLANLCLPYHLGNLGELVGYTSIDPSADSSLPSEEEVHRTYCEAAGVTYPIASWSFFVAFSCFRLAVIIQGVAMRNAKGVASSASGNVSLQVQAADAMCNMGCEIMTKAFSASSTASRL